MTLGPKINRESELKFDSEYLCRIGKDCSASKVYKYYSELFGRPYLKDHENMVTWLHEFTEVREILIGESK